MKRIAIATRCLLALIVLFLAVHSYAQDTLRSRYGVGGGDSFNEHTADFRALPGVPNCCPLFGSGTGSGPVAGFLYETPLASSLLFGLGANYINESALLSDNEYVTVISGGSLQAGTFKHTIQANLASLGIEPYLSYRLFANFFLSAGARAGYLLTKTYTQQEQITAPSAGTFLNPDGTDSHSRIRNHNSGTLPDAATVLMQGIAGLSYELPLNSTGTLFLVPQVSYALAFNNVVSGLDWKPNGLIAGISIKYSPRPTPPKAIERDSITIRDTTTQIIAGKTDTTVNFVSRTFSTDSEETPIAIQFHTTINEAYRKELPEPKKLECAMSAVGVDADGTEHPIASLTVEEFLSTNAYPLLAFIFFGENADTMPSKFVRLTPAETKAFKPEQLFGEGTMDIYRNVLNVIAYRMQKYPNAVLTLTGCNADVGDEKGNTALSQKRAEAVRDYLVNVWGLAPARLVIASHNLPEKPSNPKSPLGQEENRRTEITCTIPEVLDVFTAYDTARVSTPPLIRYKLSASSPKGIGNWRLDLSQDSKALTGFADPGDPPANVDWDLENQQQTVPRFSGVVHNEFTVTDGAGEICSKAVDLPTNVVTLRQKKAQNLGDYRIERFSLVLFEFGKSAMTDAQQRIINLIKTNITPTSLITIEGYTDKTGTPQSNARLALSRAKSTKDALGRTDALVYGIGDKRLLYPNETPEGRFYCRTVQIEVKTPVK